MWSSRFHRGDWVTVRSEAEILATLDDDGTLDGLPFMPEMRRFCGRDFRVRSRADRTLTDRRAYRRMADAVHLTDTHCDGAEHDGCGRRCSFYWKERWLQPADGPRRNPPAPAAALARLVTLRVRQDDGQRPFCQATEVVKATSVLRLMRHADLHLSAFWNESSPPLDLVRSFAIHAWLRLGGRDYWSAPLRGTCVGPTPVVSLGLRPGERVRVKSRAEILATLDARGFNRGMEFPREMLRFCGRRFTVLARAERIIDGDDAVAHSLKHTVILDGTLYNNLAQLGIPREDHLFWHECWLERVDGPVAFAVNDTPLAFRAPLPPAPPASRRP
jgi:hypothetical protein